MLITFDCALIGAESLEPHDFYRPAHSHIFEAILRLVSDERPVDVVTVADDLTRIDLLEMVGGRQVLYQLQAGVAALDHGSVRTYAQMVKSCARRRHILYGLSEAAEQIHAHADPDEVLTRLLGAGTSGPSKGNWAERDLTDLWEPEELVFPPAILGRRLDGENLLFPAALGIVVAPPESGKSMLLMAMVVEASLMNRHSFYVDLESRASRVMPRLRHHLDGDAARDRFHYIQPTGAMTVSDRWAIRREVANHRPALVVLDGYNALLAKHSKSSNDPTDVSALVEEVVDPWRSEYTCVVLVDHVSKEDKRLGNMDPMGSVAKLGLVDYGLYLRVNQDARFAKGATGCVNIVISKDRDGELRGKCADKESFGSFWVQSNARGQWQHCITMPEGMSAHAPAPWRTNP